MHIVHLITRLIIGGAQENTVLTCEGLHAHGRRVTLLTGPTRGPEGSLVARARAGGYELVEVPELIRAVNPWYDLRCQRELTRMFREMKPDVVHTHSSKAGIIGRLAAADAGVPIIVHTVHGMSFNRTQHPLVRWFYRHLERRCARVSHAIVTVANAMIDQTVQARVCPREKMLTVYSGMEIEAFDPARYDRNAVRREWGIASDQIVVGAVARLFRKKGYEQLIPAMVRAAAANAHLRFVWVGDGAQRGDYEAQLAQAGLRNRTLLTGLVPPGEVPRMLSGFDILAHASQWEGLPRVVVQGLLMRVPAVAFAIDGTPEVVRDRQTGRLIPLNAIDAFADAIVELAADAGARAQYGAAGREWCLARFPAEVMVSRLDQLYERLRQGGAVREA